MNYIAIVDGPNLISRLIKKGLSHDLIVEQFSLNKLLFNAIRPPLGPEFDNPSTLGLEFIYSPKQPGPEGEKLSRDQWKNFLDRTSKENAVTLTKVDVASKNEEKGVDIAVAVRLIEAAEICDIVCLVSSDKDYVPALEYLKRKGKYICTVGFADSHPIELTNLSYIFIDITKYLTKEY